MIILLPFNFSKHNSEKNLIEIFDSFDNFMEENKFSYEFEKNLDKKTFWFKQNEEKIIHTRHFQKVKVRIKENGSETVVKATYIVSKAKLFFLIFFLSQYLLIWFLAVRYHFVLFLIVTFFYLIVLNIDQYEYKKPKMDLMEIIK